MEDGKPLFMDSDHVSGHGNRVLYPAFRAFLGSLYFAGLPEYRSLAMNAPQLEGVGTSGVSGAEEWGRWTDGQHAEFHFARPLPTGPFKLVLETRGAFGTIAGQEIEVRVGSVTQRIVAPATPTTIELPFPQGGAGADSVELNFPPLKSPKQMGLSEDSRLLGLSLVKVQIAPIAPATATASAPTPG
jgi:hypothetical protein